MSQPPSQSHTLPDADLAPGAKRKLRARIPRPPAARIEVQQTVGSVTGGAVAGANIGQIAGDAAVVAHIVNIYRDRGERSEADYRAALDNYLDWVRAQTGKVVLRGIKRGGQQAVELSLEEVYVPLAAEPLPDARETLKRNLGRRDESTEPEPPRQISMQELLAQGNCLAVIGAPGCGKTTVLQHIAWTLAEALRTGQPALAADRLGLTGELPLPIYVPLSLYAEHRRRFADHPDPRQRQLATFINHHLMERQAALNLPDDFFATLLEKGRHVILLLDGLDEVPNEDERALVSQGVRDLTYSRRQTRFVVTSRTPAYQGRAVLGNDFRVVRVLPISPEQVADLIRRAYRAIYPAEVETDERNRRADGLIADVAKLEDERTERLGGDAENRLVTTPLLVRMLLIVHFNLRRLPDQRAELYVEVVDTLLTSSHNPDEAVAQRLAQLGGDWRGRRDLCQYLAFQMHSRGREAGREIGERELTDLLCRYLTERRRKLPEAAELLVSDFVATSRQRGGLMEELAGRHRFTHLSFQEFLTARYLAEGEREVERIARFIEDAGRPADPWWREPALLTIGYLNTTAPDTAGDLVRRLACLDDAGCPRTPRLLATAELAATAFLEWGGADATRCALVQRLADLLTDPNLVGVPGSVRAAAGRALARLGDPRPGVGLTPDGLPDIAWCDVPAGEFTMGSDESDREKPPHKLTLPAFQISQYPITNAQFAAFVQDGGYTPQWRRCWTAAGWEWKGDRTEPDKAGGAFDLPNHPVVAVTWYEAAAFCRWLGEKLGCAVTLPTEAQCEKAARGGVKIPHVPHVPGTSEVPGTLTANSLPARRYPWGDQITPDHANYDATGIGATSAVGIFPQGASPYGVLDISGNVWEWCLTKWRNNYKTPPDDDPAGDAMRTLRGGAYYGNVDNVRCAYRYGRGPDDRNDRNGFRVARSSP
ncbi:MAG: SUMF1/EgtB/PvdO family nonheme iron enzyme [Chloroflexi bacterium]|nr:SUMF1/EgtB/PvdO family nonheme iron enzyme [Chloroflexota bacterium]